MDEIVVRLTRARRRRKEIRRQVNIRDIDTNELLFSFMIQPVHDEQIDQATSESTVYLTATGDPMPEGRVDQTLYRCRMIWEATIPEDRARVWANPRIMAECNTLDPIDVINETLMPGQKIGVFSLIADISGFAFKNFSEAVDEAKKP